MSMFSLLPLPCDRHTASGSHYGYQPMDIYALPFYFLYIAFSGLLCWHDVRTGLLPDRFTCPLLWAGLLFHLCLSPSQISYALWGAIAGYGIMALLYWGYRAVRHREGLGYGDVKYLAALGAWHCWQQLPLLMLVATGLACAFILGKAVCYRTIVEMKNPLPFGPFMGAAGFILAGVSVFNLQL